MVNSYKDIKGFFAPETQTLYDVVVDHLEDGAAIAEVGCCFGQSTAYLAGKVKDSGKDIKVFAVDIWVNNLHRFQQNMYDFGVADVITPIRATSYLASLSMQITPTDKF